MQVFPNVGDVMNGDDLTGVILILLHKVGVVKLGVINLGVTHLLFHLQDFQLQHPLEYQQS